MFLDNDISQAVFVFLALSVTSLLAIFVSRYEMLGMPKPRKRHSRIGKVTALHQRWEHGDRCLHCGKPEAELVCMEKCDKHVYGVNTIR
jgi:hypothetical protein